jgi:hypothetical protein
MKLKKLLKSLLLTVVLTVIIGSTVAIKNTQAQELSPGVDLYSTYVWRGVAYSGPSIQPYVDFTAGNFTLGAWGSQGIDGIVGGGVASNGFQEMDLYASYSFDFGLSLGVTDYYYPGSLYFDGESHAFELNGGFSSGDFSIAANYIVNEAAGAGSAGGDMYFELGYGPVFIGGGDGWHTSDGDFDIVNIGVSASKEIEITDSFSLPISGSVILNPHTEQLYILAGISL